MPNLQIAFQGMKVSDAVAADVRARFHDLERFCDRIISCRVAVGLSHSRHRQGNLFHVRVDLRLPGREIVIGRSPDLDGAHKDIYVALRDTFDAARRRLEEYTRRRRVRIHPLVSAGPDHGRVLRLLYEDGRYGFLGTEDGREIYFHSRSVLNNRFDDLEVGTEVRFIEESGEEGPQASTIDIVGKQNRRTA